MVSWGIDLSRSAVQAMGEGFGTALPYILLILGATATSYYQQAQIQRRSTGPVNPQMQMITRIMPLFITFISLTLPAALVIYFFVSGCYRIGQQAIISRHIYTDEVKERLAAARASGDTGPITTTGRDAGGGAPRPAGSSSGCSAPRRRRATAAAIRPTARPPSRRPSLPPPGA